MSFNPSSYGASTVGNFGQMVSGVGSIISAQNATAMGSYNADVSLQQAASQQASYNINLQEYQKQSQEQLAEQQASYAKSGVAFTGTPVDDMVQSLTSVNFNEAVMSYNNQIAQEKLQNKAALDRYTAAQQAEGDYAKGITSILGGGLSIEQEIARSGGNDGTGSYTLPGENVPESSTVEY
jgi:hypothetical protein